LLQGYGGCWCCVRMVMVMVQVGAVLGW
jgi:hypothetical protein